MAVTALRSRHQSNPAPGFPGDAGSPTRTAAHRRWSGGLALCALALACASEAPPPEPVPAPESLRTPPAGDVVGIDGRYGSHTWLGIPFAEPPTGPRRWRAPEPLPRWDGVREATAHGEACVQFASPVGGLSDEPEGSVAGSEDCLTLNVYAPRFAPDAVPTGRERLPVFFWIHGGGNTIGTSRFYEGGNLATSQDAIVVTVQYRLGPFGWFRHDSLSDGNDVDRSGNFGTLDLVRGLEWVRDNIAAFGGDPDNVTIFGESAGGTNVFTLLLSPLAHGLYHKAIGQSPGIGMATVAEAENPVSAPEPGHANSSAETALRFLVATGRAPDAATARSTWESMGASARADFLRGVPAEALLETYRPESGLALFDLPRVFRDGVVLPAEEPLEVLRRPGGAPPVPVMLGTNRDENKLFLFLSPEFVRYWFGFLPRLRDPHRYALVAEYQSRWWKATGVDEPAEALTASGHTVYVYRFDWDELPTLLGLDLSEAMGAAHGFEIPFVFGHFELGRLTNRMFTEENAPGRRELSRQMMSYWSQFAVSGTPATGRQGDLPEWLPFDVRSGEAPRTLVFDTEADGGVRMSSHREAAEAILEEVTRDERMRDLDERCAVYRQIARWSDRINEGDYVELADGLCRGVPFAAAR
ncbi:MAG: carboxylesterase family protein [Proteobacteria bacterium]|nr:carboxylesterase family protein [Pseudomonadota bacterium]